MEPVGVCLSPPGLICLVPFQFAVTGPAKARHRDAPLCKRRGDRYLHYNQLWVLSAVVAQATEGTLRGARAVPFSPGSRTSSQYLKEPWHIGKVPEHPI